MPDKEKVIEGLNHCFHGQEFCDEIECPYYIEQNSCCLEECQENLKEDVLSLLKKQEAVEPIHPDDEFGLYRCGKCYHQLFRCVDKYCSRCGQAVKWNDDNQRD